MTLLLERAKEDQGTFRTAGVVAYSSKLDSEAVKARVGDSPLSVLAVGVYGRNRTDPLIDEDDALRILSSEENRDLLRLGKVAFVCPIVTPSMPKRR